MEGCQAGICVLSDNASSVVDAVRRLPRRGEAFVSSPIEGWVVVFEETSDGPEEDRLTHYTAMLSELLCTTAIGFLVIESDVLVYVLVRDGCLMDYFNSWPDYYDETLQTDDEAGPTGDADLLVEEVFRDADPAAIRAILDGEYDFAEERLAALTAAMGLPSITAQWDYYSLSHDPDAAKDFTRVPEPFGILPEEAGN